MQIAVSIFRFKKKDNDNARLSSRLRREKRRMVRYAACSYVPYRGVCVTGPGSPLNGEKSREIFQSIETSRLSGSLALAKARVNATILGGPPEGLAYGRLAAGAGGLDGMDRSP